MRCPSARSGTRASRSAATSARLLPVARARVSTAIGVSISPAGWRWRAPRSRRSGSRSAGCRRSSPPWSPCRRLGIVLPGRHRRDVDDHARALPAHDRQRVLAGHHRAAQIDGDDAVERVLGDLGRRRVAAGDADADVVVQDVDAAPALCAAAIIARACLAASRRPRRHAVPPSLRDHRRGLLGGGEVAVDGEHPRAFLREAQAVARPLPMPSPGPWPAPTTIAILLARRMGSSPAKGRPPPALSGSAVTFVNHLDTCFGS